MESMWLLTPARVDSADSAEKNFNFDSEEPESTAWLTRSADFGLSKKWILLTDAKNIIKTEHADEDPKGEFYDDEINCKIAASCKESWNFSKAGKDTFTRVVDHIPATADREAMSVWETLVRAMIGSETAKMLKSMGIPEMAKEEFEKEKHGVQEFLTGGPNPSTQAAISKEQFWKKQMRREELKIIREMKRKTMKRRIMTRKTAEREKRKSEAMENPPKKQIWVKIRR
uniref:Uncharacterized protein n=1 Tax=Tetranychus urticae TaxID=32264 RepID=T1JTV1_TETUR